VASLDGRLCCDAVLRRAPCADAAHDQELLAVPRAEHSHRRLHDVTGGVNLTV
jgi:hypothetical protein